MKRFDTRLFTAIMALALAGLGYAPRALALTTLKQVQISNGAEIDLLFDGKIKKDQIRTEFFNDIIQLSLTDVSVYPAKISSVSGGSLSKIFAYQYAPKLVRCRLTVKGKAEDYKDKVAVAVSGRILTVRIGDGSGSDQAGLQSAASRAVPGSQGDHSPAAKSAGESEPPAQAAAARPLDTSVIADGEERALLERVIKSAGSQPGALEKKPAHSAKADTPAKGSAADSSDTLVTSSSSAARAASSEDLPVGAPHPIAAGKPLPSPMRAFGKLGLVLGLFGLIALGLKKVLAGGAEARPGFMGALSRMAKKSLGREGKMIEVVSSHYLGPKKSIAVVKIAGRMMVLGVTNDSINLISQLSEGGDFELDDLGSLGLEEPAVTAGKPARTAGTGAVAAGPAVFSDLLNAEKGKPAAFPTGGPLTAAIQNYQQSRATATPVQTQAPAQRAQPQRAQAAQQGPALGGPSVRTQIRSRLEGLKQL